MHFTVYVFHDNTTSVGELLAPYDENMATEAPHIVKSKAQAIADCRKMIEDFKNGRYKEYLADPKGYEEEYAHIPSHIQYVKEKFPKMLNWTDEECFAYEKEGYEVDEDGNLLSTYNENSKWDWYAIGGRWSGNIPDNEATIGELNLDEVIAPYAFITNGGEWVGRGEMGWFGCVGEEMDEDAWDAKFREYMKSLPKDTIVTLVDCHI